MPAAFLFSRSAKERGEAIPSEKAPVRRRASLRFGPTTLLVVCVVLSALLAWKANDAARQRRLRAWVENRGGEIDFSYKEAWYLGVAERPEPPGPPWLRDLIGPEYFERVSEVNLSASYSTVTDDDLAFLAGYPDVRQLVLMNGGDLSDAGLVHVSKMAGTSELYLGDPRFGDEGLRSIARMPRLRTLDYGMTTTTDAGVAHLGTSASLERLWLNGTEVTDKGLAALRELPNLDILGLQGTQVRGIGFEGFRSEKLTNVSLAHCPLDDEGAKSLSVLRSLRSLDLSGTRISDDGLAHVASLDELRWLCLADTAVTDAGLASLAASKRLKYVDLSGTRVTEEGKSRLQASRPGLVVP